MQKQQPSIIKMIKQKQLHQQRVISNFCKENTSQGLLKKNQISIGQEGRKSQIRQQKALSNDDRKQILDASRYPICCIGLLTFKIRQCQAFGTAFLIKGSLILTAGHNIYHRGKTPQAGFFHSNIYFQPSRNGLTDDNMRKKIVSYYLPEEYKSFESGINYKEWDWAVLKIDQDLSDQFGYFGISAKWNNKDDKLTIIGYPKDKNKKYINLDRFYLWGQKQKKKVIKIQDRIIQYQISTDVGQSGSPIFIRDSQGKYWVVGVHVRGLEDQIFNQGVRINQQMVEQINRQFKQSVSVMNLSNMTLSKSDLSIVCSRRWGDIQYLNLSHNGLKAADIASLGSKHFESLKSLEASDNKFDQESCQIINKCFKKLQELDLGNNQEIGDAGIKNLFHKGNPLQNLQFLNLQNCSISSRVSQICLLQSLRILVLINNNLQTYAVQLLLQAQWERLQKLFIGANGVNKKISQIAVKKDNMFINILENRFKYKKIDAYDCTWRLLWNYLTQVQKISQQEYQQQKREVCCRLTGKLMVDPVYLNCGHRFQREIIMRRYEQEKYQKCPICGHQTPQKYIRSNDLVNKQIESFKKKMMKNGQKWLKQKIADECFSTLKFQIEFDYSWEEDLQNADDSN